MVAIEVLKSHVYDLQAQIKILNHKDLKKGMLVLTSDIKSNIEIREKQIQEIQEAIELLSKSN